MPNEAQEKLVKISDLPRIKSERFVSAYANHTEAVPGFYDVRLVFCQIRADIPGQPEIEEYAGIALTWEHAARVRDLLQRLVANYEKEHGGVRQQPEVTPPHEDSAESSTSPSE